MLKNTSNSHKNHPLKNKHQHPLTQQTLDEASINVLKAQDIILPLLKQETKRNQRIWGIISGLMLNALKQMKIPLFKRRLFWWYFTKLMKQEARKGKTLLEIETTLRKHIRKHFKQHNTHEPQLRKRAQRSYQKIKPYLKGHTILDLGAGDGLLGEIIQKNLNKKVTLIDVIDYNYSTLPLITYNDGEPIPLPSNSQDTTILYTVLHHANNPEQVLKEAVRVTKQRIIIVEGYVDDPITYSINCFFDWFLNRVAKDEDVNIPLNYKSTTQWNQLFQQLNMKLTIIKYLGIDEPIGPEFHVLYVIDKNQNENTSTCTSSDTSESQVQ